MNDLVSQDKLISIARDRDVDEATRTDAISFLSEFPDLISLQVLIDLSLQVGEDFYVYEKIGESIGNIVSVLGKEHLVKLLNLPEEVRLEALAIIKIEHADWLEK